jgi:3-methylcrotonyl-CoA carboxylase alpha subunit
MIAKLIAHAPNRRAGASPHLAAACRECEIWPVKTNAACLGNALAQVDFVAGDVDTGFIESHLEALIGTGTVSQNVLEAAATARLAAYKILAALIGFRLNAPPDMKLRLRHGAETHYVSLHPPLQPPSLNVAIHAHKTIVFEAGWAFARNGITADPGSDITAASDGAVLSPMPGHSLAVAVAEGDTGAKGALLLGIHPV